jgi:hypothetical protein
MYFYELIHSVRTFIRPYVLTEDLTGVYKSE